MRSQREGDGQPSKGLSLEIKTTSYEVRESDFPEASNEACGKGEHVETYRGRRPWRVVGQCSAELGRAVRFHRMW